MCRSGDRKHVNCCALSTIIPTKHAFQIKWQSRIPPLYLSSWLNVSRTSLIFPVEFSIICAIWRLILCRTNCQFPSMCQCVDVSKAHANSIFSIRLRCFVRFSRKFIIYRVSGGKAQNNKRTKKSNDHFIEVANWPRIWAEIVRRMDETERVRSKRSIQVKSMCSNLSNVEQFITYFASERRLQIHNLYDTTRARCHTVISCLFIMIDRLFVRTWELTHLRAKAQLANKNAKNEKEWKKGERR